MRGSQLASPATGLLPQNAAARSLQTEVRPNSKMGGKSPAAPVQGLAGEDPSHRTLPGRGC